MRMADNLPPSSADVTESGSLNLPERPALHRAVYCTFLVVVLGLTTLPPSCDDCLKIWEPQLPGTLRDCQGL
jgi:hypothetical protein